MSNGSSKETQSERLIRVEVKLDSIYEKLDGLSDLVTLSFENHEKRLSRVERVVWAITGVFGLFVVPVLLMLAAQVVQQLF